LDTNSQPQDQQKHSLLQIINQGYSFQTGSQKRGQFWNAWCCRKTYLQFNSKS